MKTSADPVRDYLSAVGREAGALPADRRQELLADLAEHIEVTRAERPDAAIGQILAELGDPRTIAATALAEAGNGAPGRGGAEPGAPVRRGKVHPLVPLLMLALAPPLAMLLSGTPGVVPVFAFRLTGAVLLCTSVHWTAVQKTTGILLTLVVPIALATTWNLVSGHAVAEIPALLANLGSLALIAGAAVWLWKVRRA